MPETYYEIGSFKFADIVMHWSRERLTHEIVITRELARGVVREGLRFQSADPRWTQSTTTFRGRPLIGYSARQGLPPIMIRSEALEHLFAIENESVEPKLTTLVTEFVTRNDFRKWLVHSGKALPEFWFSSDERYAKI